MNTFPIEITKTDLENNGLKSVTWIAEGTLSPRLIIDRGEKTEKTIDGIDNINYFIKKLK
jgi:hypothetical protein